MAHGVVILECPRTPQLEVWARSYGVLSGALLRDSAQLCECCGEGRHSPRSDARESRGHNLVNTHPNGQVKSPSASTQRVDANGVIA